MSEKGANSMYDRINEHEERIIILEKSDIEIIKRMEKVENNYVNLENTILKSSQSTQEVFRDTIKNQWELITERDKNKHEIAVSNQSIKKTNVEKKWEWLGKLTMAGGIIYLLIDKFAA